MTTYGDDLAALRKGMTALRMGETDNQVFLQYIVSLGANGAHTF